MAEIAAMRGLTDGTIASHLGNAILAGRGEDLQPAMFLSADMLRELAEVFAAAGQVENLGPIKELAGDRFGYRDLHLFRAFRKAGKV